MAGTSLDQPLCLRGVLITDGDGDAGAPLRRARSRIQPGRRAGEKETAHEAGQDVPALRDGTGGGVVVTDTN